MPLGDHAERSLLAGSVCDGSDSIYLEPSARSNEYGPMDARKAFGRLSNTPVHDNTQTATTSKALGALAVALRDILAHMRSLG